MERNALLNAIDDRFLRELYGYCYRRCSTGTEAEDLCSDIVLAVVKAASRTGEVDSAEAFIWKIAHNVYADYSRRRRREAQHTADAEMYAGGTAASVAVWEDGTQRRLEEEQQLRRIWREIAFLSKAYREVMILHYLEEKPIPAIAEQLGISPGTVRQRLFYARQSVRNEVSKMDVINNKPLALQNMKFSITGTGNPLWGDPRNTCFRQLSTHVVWLCRNRAASAREIADALNVPMPYIEEELAIQCAGENGEYGLIKKLDNGRYTINFLLLDQKELERAQAVYTDRIPLICQSVAEYIEANKEAYLSFPYLNHTVDLNRILWQQVSHIGYRFSDLVDNILAEKHFPGISPSSRPFSVFGRLDNGREYGCGWDGIGADNLCGYAHVALANIYITRIRPHFHCGHNIATDPQLQLAIRAIHGLPAAELTEAEKEPAAKAIECGYLCREGDTLYTNILVSRSDRDLFAISDGVAERFRPEAEAIAAALAEQIRACVPAHLMSDYRFFNSLAYLPVLDALVESLIERGLLTPPENGVGGEGCWMTVTE